jgi:SRR1 domain
MECEIRHTEWMKECESVSSRTVEGPFLRKILEQVKASFEALGWFTHEVLVLCLGLGSPMQSKSAAAQLVFLTSICHTLNIVCPNISSLPALANTLPGSQQS